MRLENKVAVVTGAGRGIGRAVAIAFAQEGADVLVNYVSNSQTADETVAEIEKLGRKAVAVKADVASTADAKNMIETAVKELGGLDILVNNAGVSIPAMFLKMTEDQWDRIINIHLKGTFTCSQAAALHMKEQKSGCIINNSSIAAIRTNNGGYLYNAAKAGVTYLTKVAGVELGPWGIRVNSISPGAVATPIFWGGSERARTLPDEENAKKLEKLTKNLANATALKKAGLPDDIAYTALFLASDEGAYISCQDIAVDGGRTALFHEPPRQ